MPTHTGKDSKGCFAQWGGHGKKYYFTCGSDSARARAIKKANAQGQAALVHGYTGNKEDTQMLNFQYVTTNVKPLIRQDQMEGKDWVVVPTQMITEGVHNGSDGPIFYPADELSKLPAVWNHKPVVVYHPVVNGVSVSACEPNQITTRKVGVLMNTKWDGETKKLGTETWLDPARMNIVDTRIAEAITKNEMMEVSTGLFMDLERKEGEWNGEKYIGIAHNMQPDHLALLPDLKGACSIEDGAGFLRVNEARRKLVINMLSHDEIRRGLNCILWTKNDNAWIDMIYNDYFIYEIEGKLYKQNYLKNDEGVQLDGLPKLVEKKVDYVEVTSMTENAVWTTAYKNELPDSAFLYVEPGGKKDNSGKTVPRSKRHFPFKDKNGKVDLPHVHNALSQIPKSNVPADVKKRCISRAQSILKKMGGKPTSNLKGYEMTKNEIVDALIENEKTSWTEEHRETLMDLDDGILTNMHNDLVELTKEIAKATENKEEKKEIPAVTNEKKETMKNAETPKPKTMEQYISEAPPEIQEALRMSVNVMNNEKARLIETIMANERCTFTKEYLETLKPDVLGAMAKLAVVETTTNDNQRIIPIFSGQQDVSVNGGKLPEPLLLPTMNFDKSKTA
jgi:Uncharacterized protein conserved in bacteria (DUF2213)